MNWRSETVKHDFSDLMTEEPQNTLAQPEQIGLGEMVPVYVGAEQSRRIPYMHRYVAAFLGYDFDRVQLKSETPAAQEPIDYLELCCVLAEECFMACGGRMMYAGDEILWNDALGHNTTNSITVQTRGFERRMFYLKSIGDAVRAPERIVLFGWGNKSANKDFDSLNEVVGLMGGLANALAFSSRSVFDGLPMRYPPPIHDMPTQMDFAANVWHPLPPDTRLISNIRQSQYYIRYNAKEWAKGRAFATGTAAPCIATGPMTSDIEAEAVRICSPDPVSKWVDHPNN